MKRLIAAKVAAGAVVVRYPGSGGIAAELSQKMTISAFVVCDYSASKASEEGADFRETFAIDRSAPVFEGACSSAGVVR